MIPDKDIRRILNNPLNIRSHFLNSSPLICFGENYIKTESLSIEERYIQLHEYLHYEDCTSWPILAMKYYWNCYQMLNKIFFFATQSELVPGFENTNLFKLGNKNLSLTSEVQGIKISALLEGSAILNYRVKRKDDELHDYSEEVLNYLISNANDIRNEIHLQGVSLCLNASKALRDKLEGKNKHLEFEDLLYTLPATLSGLIAWRTFAHSLILCGWDSKNKNNLWKEVNEFIFENYFQIWDTYLNTYTNTLYNVLIKFDFDEFIDMLLLRELSLVGFHCFQNITYSIFYKTVEPLIKQNIYLCNSVLSPLLNLLKITEVMNKPTLQKWNVPKLWDRWIPVPVIIFPDRVFSSLRLDFDNAPSGFFLIRWQDSIKDPEDYLCQMRWIVMLFMNQLYSTIRNDLNQVVCPIREWVDYQYKKSGILNKKYIDDFLMNICNQCLNIDFQLQNQNGKIIPSERYCNYKLGSQGHKKQEKCLCYYHHTLNTCLYFKEL